jgi:predicted permease
MSWPGEFWRRITNIFRRERFDRELQEEMRLHKELREREHRQAGANRDDARYKTQQRFGNELTLREESRDMSGWNWLENFAQDVRFGARMLRKNLGFTVVAILTLALGIGANTAIFSVVNALLFRPLAVRSADRLTVIAVQTGPDSIPAEVSYPDYRDYREQSDAFTDISAYSLDLVGLGSAGHADRLVASFVTSNYFSMLGIRPALGRMISPGEGDAPKTGAVVVLGHHYWEQRFSSDPSVIGRRVSLNGQALTIIGVVPKNFRGLFPVVEMDAYVPMGMIEAGSSSSEFFTDRNRHELHVFGMLKPGVTTQHAQASLTVIAQRLAQQFPQADQGQTIRVIPERLARPTPSAGRSIPVAAGAFMILVGLVLLVSCVNVANLLLARAAARKKEFAIRSALGAGRTRIIRQSLTETILLALAGGVAGALLGNWVCRALQTLRPLGDFPIRFNLAFDWRVFSYVLGITLITGIIAGVVPALRVSRTDLNETLRESGRGSAGDGGRHPIRNILVIAQVAGSLVLLVAAGLFVRSLAQVRSIDLGFNPHNVLNVGLDPGLQGYEQPRAEAFFRDLLRRAKSLPGVESASFAYTVPMNYYSMDSQVYAEGQASSAPGRRTPEAAYNVVTPEYFTTMQIPILEGRAFTDADTSASGHVAIVNKLMAERLWPNQDAIGRKFSTESATGPFITVVGVARNSRNSNLTEPPDIYFYESMAQNYHSTHVLQFRTSVPPESLIPAIEAQVRDLDPRLPVFDVMPMERTLAGVNGYFLFHVGVGFAGVLSGLGMLLAIVGLYGVVSFTANQRTHEIGIRMALGAQPVNIVVLVLRQAVVLVAVGIGLGLIVALAVTRLLSTMLIGVAPHDTITFATVASVLVVVTLVACFLPARRAARLDPSVALRYE